MSTLWTSVLWLSAWGCQHGGVSGIVAPFCTDLQLPCSQMPTGICSREEITLQRRHQLDGGVPLTEGKGMQHLLVTEKAWVVLHIGSSFKCVSSHRLAFCFSAMLDAGVGKLNSPKVNFLSYYKLTLGGCYSDCRAASELCKHSLPLPITLRPRGRATGCVQQPGFCRQL